MGIAYGFLDTAASREQVEGVMPTLREYAQTPSDLEIAVYEGLHSLNVDNPSLREQLGTMRNLIGREYRFWLEARRRDLSNEEAAGYMDDIIIQMMTQRWMMEDRFAAAVLYEDADRAFVEYEPFEGSADMNAFASG